MKGYFFELGIESKFYAKFNQYKLKFSIKSIYRKLILLFIRPDSVGCISTGTLPTLNF